MKRYAVVRVAGAAAAVVLLTTIWELAFEANGSGELLSRFSADWLVGLLAFGVFGGVLGLLSLFAVFQPAHFAERIGRPMDRVSARLGHWRWPLAGMLLVLPTGLIFGPTASVFSTDGIRASILLLSAVLAGLILPQRGRTRAGVMALALLVSTSIFIAAHEFTPVTDYPFKLGWSEGNRLWDYSLYFGLDRYQIAGEFQYPTYLTPGRHGLWGLAYLIPAAPIWLVRLWNAVLWIAPALLLGWALARRKRGALSPGLAAAFALWVFTFISQGPIYAPLLLSAILIAWGYRRGRPGLTAIVVFAACLYAGLSRWTWLVAPAIWAASWALLDARDAQGWYRKLRWPAAYTLAGLAGALASQQVMRLAFPREGAVFSTALSQDLLWYRLLPSPTNPLGLIPGLLLAVLPIAIILVLIYRRPRAWLAWLGVGGGMLAFLAVGLVASVKIGGGNNLHNLDMFLVDVVLLAGYGLHELAKHGQVDEFLDLPIVRGLLTLAVIIPAWWVIRSGGPLQLPSDAETRTDLARVREQVQAAASRGQVLFIDQRQLLTFGRISGVPLELDYELKDLMNQAMAHNEIYLSEFEEALAEHRFELIVVDPQREQYQGRTHPFGEENDAWVRNVTIPLLEYYQPQLQLSEISLWTMTPRVGSEPQP
ncbi:MAG: hypothetical protein WBR18_07330 [Anaerolineales bacterium]